ncbi:MAG: guanylate kinase [Mariprofundus sp.]|nr:guanylate kinase [Mariprofundus sp.]
MSGRLFIVSGPSGAGKSSLCSALLTAFDTLKLTVSCTTRQPRPGEVDGREYNFLSVTEFELQCKSDEFIEWAAVHGNLYGTRKSDVERQLQQGFDVLLEIDWQGARQVAEKIAGAIRIFILPPSLRELQDRLAARGQDDEATMQRRVAAAEMEISHAGEAEYQVVNDDFNQALAKLQGIFSTHC